MEANTVNMDVVDAAREATLQERARILRLLTAPRKTGGMQTGMIDPRTHYMVRRFIVMLCEAINSGQEEL